MRFAIIGAGGVGGYLGVKLAAAGHEVAVLARGAHLDAIRGRGLTLEDGDEVTTVELAVATDRGEELGAPDVAIFTVKGQDLAAAIDTARPAVRQETLALPFLNGVEATGMLAEAFGKTRALVGVAQISAFIAGPGVIRKATPRSNFLIGGPDGGQNAPEVSRIVEAFRAAGINAPERRNVRIDLWQKFVFLTALSATTAGARVDLGTVRATSELWALFGRLAEEAAAVARAHGVALAEDAADKARGVAEEMPAEVRASMAHDLAAGKRLELDWLSGAVVRLGRQAGVEAPSHAAVAALLAPWREGAGETANLP